MKPPEKLLVIKIAHTLIWAVFVSIIFYVLYCGLSGDISTYTWIGIALVLGEGAVLLIFGFVCPLTIMARKYSDSRKDNFDIYLPNWLAKYNKWIYSTMFLLIAIVFIFNTSS